MATPQLVIDNYPCSFVALISDRCSMEYSGGLSALGFAFQIGTRVLKLLSLFLDSVLPLLLGFYPIYRVWSNIVRSGVQPIRLKFLTHLADFLPFLASCV